MHAHAPGALFVYVCVLFVYVHACLHNSILIVPASGPTDLAGLPVKAVVPRGRGVVVTPFSEAQFKVSSSTVVQLSLLVDGHS